VPDERRSRRERRPFATRSNVLTVVTGLRRASPHTTARSARALCRTRCNGRSTSLPSLNAPHDQRDRLGGCRRHRLRHRDRLAARRHENTVVARAGDDRSRARRHDRAVAARQPRWWHCVRPSSCDRRARTRAGCRAHQGATSSRDRLTLRRTPRARCRLTPAGRGAVGVPSHRSGSAPQRRPLEVDR
jgi:hypothetical protein